MNLFFTISALPRIDYNNSYGKAEIMLAKNLPAII